MTQDKLLELVFCDPDGWQDAINRAADKDINQRDLRELCTPEWRMAICKMIKDGTYNVVPPHQIDIPKDEYDENGNMKYRHVYCNEPKDRVLFIRIYQVLSHECTERVHPSCKSYQHGISCGDSVKEFMQTVSAMPTVHSVIGSAYTDVIGWKSDLSKYFDSVPLQYIDEAFDMVERKFGHSAIIDLLRRYYHSDWYFDTEGNLVQEYKSMKQGCAVAAWLANVILYHIDARLSHMAGRYMRYSDDILFVGPDSTLAFATLKSELLKMEMTLNRKKVEHKYTYRIDITGKAFEDAFTGYGCFFTMQNMIRFHGCNIKGCTDALQSEAKLNEWARANADSAWWLWGALKSLIEHNNFDLRAKQNEWRNK